MISNKDAVLVFRFGKQKWIDLETRGKLSLPCPGKFIYQAIQTGNLQQGDPREAVFARLKKSDAKIEEMQHLLGKDLEILEDGAFCLLRRRSAKMKPIYCVYAYTAEDILNDGQPKESGNLIARHDFDPLMYESFASSTGVRNVVTEAERFSQLTIRAKPFIDRITIALVLSGHRFQSKLVDYDRFKAETFFVPPTDDYDELFFKFPEYSYQHECRFCINDFSFLDISERFPLEIIPLKENEYEKTYVPIYLLADAVAKKRCYSLGDSNGRA